MTDELIAAARDELVSLWSDLTKAIRHSANGVWSMECDGLQERIVRFTKLVGPTPWQQIQVPLVMSGHYERIHREIGAPVEVDWDELQAMWNLYVEQSENVMRRG